MTPAEYSAETALLADGFLAGIAESKKLNTVWRQSSFVAAAVAQLMANVTGENILDDGNTSSFIAQLAATISGIDPGSLLGTSGYQELPGGFLLQWGRNQITSGGQTITFPLAFTSACYGVLTCEGAAGNSSWGTGVVTIHGAGDRTVTNYKAWALSWTGSGWAVGNITQFYLALGK
jgi:hypothetical protein